MYCPSCGAEDRQQSLFCRSCGTDLRPVKPLADRQDALTASAISAREQISLAVADKIRQMDSGKEFRRLAHELLPAVEKFLRSPEERRLRRVRAGVITTGVGLAATIAALLAALAEGDLIGLMIPAFILLMVGLSIVINGLFFTVMRKKSSADTADAIPPQLKGVTRPEYQQPLANATTNDLGFPTPVSSVTDHTTHHLKSKP